MKPERYTTKCERNALWDCDYEPNVELKGLLDKLGELEDIEEELGISIATLFKALKNGIWVSTESIYYGLKTTHNGALRLFECRLLENLDGIGIIHKSWVKGKEIVRTLDFKNYGKEWALTEEELVKNGLVEEEKDVQ